MRLTKGKPTRTPGGRDVLSSRDIIGPARPALRQLREQMAGTQTTLVVDFEDGERLLIRRVAPPEQSGE